MNIALNETRIEWEDKKTNLDRLKNDLKALKKFNLDILLLPEMSFTGFSMNVKKTHDSQRNTIESVIKIAAENNVMIGFGWVDYSDEKYTNHYSIVDSKQIIMDYIKIHPFSYGGETAVFSGGRDLPVCSICGFNAGIQICYDLRFPDTFQILSKRASLIIVPANWPQKREKHWDVLLQARAIENQVYLAGINCVGEMNGLNYSGHSIIYSPDGKKCEGISVSLKTGNNAYIYEISNDVLDYRTVFPVKKDRKENLYRKFEDELGLD